MMRKIGLILLLVIIGAITMAVTGPQRVLGGLDELDRLTGGASPAAAREAPGASALPAPAMGVSALGRLEPEGGIFQIAGPSTPVVVIGELLVDDGDVVEAGQTLATLDALPLLEADVASLEAELAYEHGERARSRELHHRRVVSAASREAVETRVHVVEARLRRARAEVERHKVRAPFDGQVIRIHARQGERVGDEGILEFGRTHAMVAIAEVYETDIDRVAIGQKAVIESPALPHPLTGRVDRIWLEVGKQDVLGTDPAARQDARVVEVQIRLDDSAPAARMSNLQVTVEIVGFKSDGVLIALSTGTGFTSRQMWLPEVRSTHEEWHARLHPRFVVDLDRDGRADFLGIGPQGVRLALSEGDRFGELQSRGAGFSELDGWSWYYDVRNVADPDGDGMLELVGYGPGGVWVGEPAVDRSETPVPEPATGLGLAWGVVLLSATDRMRRRSSRASSRRSCCSGCARGEGAELGARF